jgi:hypothetical protein
VKFFSACGSIGSGVGLLIILFKRVFVHWVEFSLMSWLHCDGIEASVIIIT